jgi:hypothetical protein
LTTVEGGDGLLRWRIGRIVSSSKYQDSGGGDLGFRA